MTLAYDVARCTGIWDDEDGKTSWREGCDDCLRRTSPGHPTCQWYMAPPPIVTFECEYRIAPSPE
jgi:hypothetical protein